MYPAIYLHLNNCHGCIFCNFFTARLNFINLYAQSSGFSCLVFEFALGERTNKEQSLLADVTKQLLLSVH